MSKKLQKSLQDYLSKIKKQTPHLQFSHSSLSSTTRKIVAGCKHPKSLSFNGKDRRKNHHDQQHHDEEVATAATLEDIDNFLIENFKSLYGQGHDNLDDGHESTNEGQNGKNTSKEYQLNQKEDISNLEGLGRLFGSPRFFTPPRDLCGSQRFFFTSSSSSSLTEEARMNGLERPLSSSEDEGSPSPKRDTQTQTHPQNYIKDGTSAIPGGIEDCITLLTVSPSPYEDFRKSMQQVLDAKVNNQQRVDWDFMEELLFCYLRLNEKKQYRYILSAFVDLIVVLRQNSSIREPEGSRNQEVQN